MYIIFALCTSAHAYIDRFTSGCSVADWEMACIGAGTVDGARENLVPITLGCYVGVMEYFSSTPVIDR